MIFTIPMTLTRQFLSESLPVVKLNSLYDISSITRNLITVALELILNIQTRNRDRKRDHWMVKGSIINLTILIGSNKIVMTPVVLTSSGIKTLR